MPIYEYQCQVCHNELEKIQKISDPALVECPACHEPALKKKISAAAFRLSGSGWYETDFKKGGTKKNLVDKGEAAGSDSGSKESKESKASSGAEANKSTPSSGTDTTKKAKKD